MAVIDIREFEDSFVIHFGTDGTRINAYTLATTLVAIADAAKAANAALNPGYELEVLVEAVGAGSFKTKIKAIYHGAGNLFSAATLKAIIVGVISTYIYEHTLEPNRDVTVVVNTNEVLIQQGDTKIVVPREVYEAAKSAEQIPESRSGVSRAFQVIQNDSDINYLALSNDMGKIDASKRIPRERFGRISAWRYSSNRMHEDRVEVTDVQITRAILERGRKRWQFVWRGIKNLCACI